jgi:hypothetical protein
MDFKFMMSSVGRGSSRKPPDEKDLSGPMTKDELLTLTLSPSDEEREIFRTCPVNGTLQCALLRVAFLLPLPVGRGEWAVSIAWFWF